jgi:HEAT repeat protein
MDPEQLQKLPLNQRVELLGGHDWRLIGATVESLAQEGQAGMEAVLVGLTHPNPRVRRGCADFMDHHGTEACVQPLCAVARQDPVPAVRRGAVHSLGCQRCKPAPLQAELLDFLIERALTDANRRVRREAICALGQRPPDPRIAEALRRVQQTETDAGLLRQAHLARRLQDPEYRQATDLKMKSRMQKMGRGT